MASTPRRPRRAIRGRGTDVGLRAFHLTFIALSVILAAFAAAWAIGQYRLDHALEYALAACGSVGAGAGLVLYGAAFQRKTKQL
jgi:hypothetical protein